MGYQLLLAQLLGEPKTDLLNFVSRQLMFAGKIVLKSGGYSLVVRIGLNRDLGRLKLGQHPRELCKLLLALGSAHVINLPVVDVTAGISHVIGAEHHDLRLAGTGIL